MMRIVPLAWQKVFESMQDAVVVCDLDYRISSFNQSAGRLIASLNRSVIGKPMAHLRSLNPELLGDITLHTASESKVYLSGRAGDDCYHVKESPICDRKQKHVGNMILLKDITETARKEKNLLDNARQLSEMNTFKDQMFNVIAHDIRDPLAVLVDLMELMEEEMQTCGETHGEIVHEMGRQIQNTFALVESLLDWFRNKRRDIAFHPAVWDLAQVVQTHVRLFQVRSESKRITISTDVPSPALVYSDKEVLDLIVRNLLSNAIKFTGHGGSIQIKADCLPDKIVVAVSDTGKGISCGGC